jgi:hypothetical protein
MTPRCPAVLVRPDGSAVQCAESAATSGPGRFHAGYVDGRRRVAWNDASDGAAVLVTLGRVRRVSELLALQGRRR